MVKAIVMRNTTTADLGEHTPKKNSVTPGQTDADFRLWARGDFKTGIWEATPGVSNSVRQNDEICQILSGSATITEADGTSFDIGPGTLFVMPAGWEGSWTIHETVRKMWVVNNVPTTTS
ncbi:hypothetical protein DM794_20155 [Paenarthrobacter ureafaciens]|uniref:DUF861 domain-containing protein n=1 Tax=Paenarthrobacter nitroguajacolicus TaxID=211146 RepID=A0A558H6E7_PAENT|nr:MULTISPECIES: cupin domain-containing protein [Paenarthrobacter]NWL29342.1 hypothetical protein [Paenarthrobacter ureafaciens]QSZ52000.1 hypothetical protein AYX19_02560 [Paenarthrobacter ureafaciens]TVU64704.1 DUF861 domain-containing protein [Paenarthrobacter nitroguajacolicus]WOC61274.1 cupin domain-containing protein [Paenarthrobacter sp. AT5]